MENFDFKEIREGNEAAIAGEIGSNSNSIINVDGKAMIMDLTSRQTSFCSMEAKTQAEKVKLYQAMNNPAKRLSDCINLEIKLKDVYVEAVNCTDEDGNVHICPRIVLIDENGVGYTCVSIGIYSSLKKLFQIFGVPTYKQPLTVVPTQITAGQNKILTLNVK